MRREPLVAPLAALAFGVAAARFVPFEAPELWCALAALFALGALGLWRRAHYPAVAACLCGFVCAGALVALAHRPGPRPEIEAAPREILTVSGCVVEPPVFFEDREQFVLELEPGARARVSFYPREGQAPPVLRYGQRVELDARVRRTRNFENPGSFDYAGYMARQDIFWTASAPAGAAVRVLPGECGSPFRAAVLGVRAAALERIERLYAGSPYQTAMMQAILIGESSKLEKVWTEDFRRTGTYHALVISGLHVAVLAGLLLSLLCLCCCPQMPALAATSAAAWVYALVSGWQAPVVRAAAGFTLFIAGRYFYRQRRLLNLLAAVAIGFLVCDPEQMFEPSFQLSFLSVAAIGALAAPLLERTTDPLRRGLAGLADTGRDLHMEPRTAHFRVELRLLAETAGLYTRVPVRWALLGIGIVLRAAFAVYESVVISALVQIGLALPMAAYFHRLSLTGLTANVVIVPLMSAAVPVGFLAVFTGWRLAAGFASLLLAWSRTIAAWHVRWEPAWRIPDPPLWAGAALTASLVAFAIVHRRSRAGGAALFGTVLVLLAVIVLHPFAPKVEAGTLELSAIDVGQSESLFLAFPDGKLMVVDGGGIPAFGRRTRPRLDVGEEVVSPYLWTRSIRRLDTLVLSHAHEDHVGGMGALLENFRPRELWTGTMPSDEPAWNALRAKAAAFGTRVVPLGRGARFAYGGAEVEVLAPSAGRQPGERADNNDSLALRVAYGGQSFLLSGDIQRDAEYELLDAKAPLQSIALKVAHHGSKSSSTPELLDAVRPAVALISAGVDNPYNFPHPDVLRRLAGRHTVVLRTDRWGLITVRTDGRRIRMDGASWAAAPRYLYLPF